MEFRDFVALAALAWGVFVFGMNWAIHQVWDRRVKMRDELARFAKDESVSDVLPSEVQSAAKHASVYLSLELAETARQVAANRARRASVFWRSVITRGVLTTLAVSLYVWAMAMGWETRSTVENFVSTSYFGLAAIVTIVAYTIWVTTLHSVRRQTGELAKFRKEVADTKPLVTHDARKFRKRTSTGGATRPVSLGPTSVPSSARWRPLR